MMAIKNVPVVCVLGGLWPHIAVLAAVSLNIDSFKRKRKFLTLGSTLVLFLVSWITEGPSECRLVVGVLERLCVLFSALVQCPTSVCALFCSESC